MIPDTREILFHGKSKDSNEWVEGFLAVINERTVIIEKESKFFYDDDCNKLQSGAKIIEIIPESKGQFIGQSDKHNNKIFERHILYDSYNNCMGVVEYHDADCMFVLATDDNEFFSFDDLVIENFEIIGNLFDNLEKLEEM